MSNNNPLIITWTQSAWEDLESIADYLLAEAVAFADAQEYVKRIFKAPEPLTMLPGAGKPGRVPNTREWLVKDTPYALIYRVVVDEIQILRVMHDRRQFPEQ